MNKTLLGFLLFFVVNLHSQKSEKHWSDGPLTWDDFNEKEMDLGGSKPDYYINYKLDKTKTKNYSLRRIKAFSFINTKTSSFSNLSKSPQILEYHQIEFDILEFYRREFQREIYLTNDFLDIKNKHKEIIQKIGQTFSLFRMESNYGSNARELRSWKRKISKQLEETEADPLPNVTFKNWGYGVFMGADYSSHSGSIANHTNNAIGLTLGFEANYRKHYFLFNMGILATKTTNELHLDTLLEKGKKMSFAQLNFCYGYHLLDKSKFTITPFLGLGATQFSENSKEEDKYMINSFSTNFGMNFDYNFKSIINLIPGGAIVKHQLNYFIRARIFLNTVNFDNQFKGTQLNTGLIVGMYSKQIH